MSSLGLSFEGVFLKFNVNISSYIDPSKFEELCLKLNLMFTQQELQQLVSAFDDDHNGMVKIQSLRTHIDSQQNFNQNGFDNNVGNNYNNQVNQFGNTGNNFNNMGAQNNIGMANNLGNPRPVIAVNNLGGGMNIGIANNAGGLVQVQQ